MAEIIGVVASGIAVGQLVGQVGNSLMKIRDFWERMGDAPGDLKTSLREIEALYLVLTSISEEQQNSISIPGRAQVTSMERTVALCHEAMDELTKLVRELDLTLEGSSRLKRKIATVRLTLKKSQIERFKARLNSAILLLSLCCQCHTRALMYRQPELIAARLMQASTVPPLITRQEHQVTIVPPSPNFECEDDAPSQNSQEPLCMSQGELRTTVNWKTRIWFPTWFSNRVWEIQSQKAYSGWDFKLRTYNIVSRNSEIVDAIRHDNIEHMRRLFIEKQASPFDRASRYDLFEVAVQYGSPSAFKLLLDQGARPTSESSLWFEMSSNLANDLVQWRSKAKDDLDAFYRLIASNTPYVDNDALDEFTSVLSCFRGSLTGFKLLVKEISPTLTLGTSEQLECFDLAFGFNYSYNSPDLIRMALGNSSISGAVVQECNSTGQTYLFAAARAVAGCSAPGFKLFIEPSVDELCALLHVSDEIDSKSFIKSFDWNSYPRCGWMALVRQLIVAGADIHAITDASETPFISALMASYDRSRSPWTCTAMAAAKRAPQMLRSWVEALHHARVDLELYGEKETELQLSGAVSKDVFGHRYSGPGHQSWRIIGFSYGARPNDWKLWVSESTDEFAGQFWDMIDHPERKIPGAWNDELDAYD